MRRLTWLLCVALLGSSPLGCPSDDDDVTGDDDSAGDDDTTGDDDSTGDDDTTEDPVVDNDGDGFEPDVDCDDGDPAVTPVWVSVTGSEDGDGSWLDPFPTVALALAADTGCVRLMGGIFREHGLEIHGSVTLIGDYGVEATRIDGDGLDRIFTVTAGSTLIVRDVHLRNGTSTEGGCLHLTDASLILEDVIIDDCVASETGGAIHATTSPVVLSDSTIKNCDATNGDAGGLWLADSPLRADEVLFHDLDSGGFGGALAIEGGEHEITRSVFTAHDALDGGAIDALGDGTLSVVGSLFHHNEADDSEVYDTAYGGAIATSGMTLSVVNCTFVDNEAEQTAGVYFHTSDPLDELELRNNLFAHQLGDAMGLDGLPTLGSGTVSVLYNGFFGNETLIDGRDNPEEFDGSNLFEDPLFVSYIGWGEENDFHLDTGSPAIDAGDPDAAYQDTDGSVADMGCYGGPQPLAE